MSKDRQIRNHFLFCASFVIWKNILTFINIFSKIYNACSEGKSFVGNGWLDKATDRDVCNLSGFFVSIKISHRRNCDRSQKFEKDVGCARLLKNNRAVFIEGGIIMRIITSAQNQLMKELASQGDCIMVGRCADVILQDYKPMNIFVYADQQSKLKRCQSRAEKNERFTEKEMLKKMKQIDRERVAYRQLFTESEWGKKESYHLCINTSDKDIKALIPAIAEYVRLWCNQN